MLTFSHPISQTTTFRVGDKEIIVKGTPENVYTEFEWRSDSGLVLAKTNNKRKAPIYFEGNSIATIPVEGLSPEEIYYKEGTNTYILSTTSSYPLKLQYNYLYY